MKNVMYISVLISYFIIILYRATPLLTIEKKELLLELIRNTSLEGKDNLTLKNCIVEYMIYFGKYFYIIYVSFILINFILFIYLKV